MMNDTNPTPPPDSYENPTAHNEYVMFTYFIGLLFGVPWALWSVWMFSLAPLSALMAWLQRDAFKNTPYASHIRFIIKTFVMSMLAVSMLVFFKPHMPAAVYHGAAGLVTLWYVLRHLYGMKQVWHERAVAKASWLGF